MKLLLKKTAVGITLIASIFSFIACQDAEDKDSKEIAEEKNEAKADSTNNAQFAEKDAQFVVDVVAANYGEVKLAQLAEQRSTNPEIKSVASTLEKDHTAVLNELKDLASTKGISIPMEEPSDAKDTYKDLSEESSKNFDKDWCKTLMDKHDKSINKFENMANDATDPDLKSFINKTLPKLREHHDKLMACHKKLK